MKALRTEIEVDAPAESVWKVISDFERYPDWNPFIREIIGEMKEGGRLVVRMEPPGGRGMTFRPVVKRVEQGREFRWLGHLLMPGLFDGEHIFEIQQIGEGKSHFVQREIFKGLLVPLFWKSLEESTRQGFVRMNEALKKRAEALARRTE